MERILNMAVCEGRHDIPQATDGAIFQNEIPSDFLTVVSILEDKAFGSLWSVCWKKDMIDHKTNTIVTGIKLNLFVTGLTVAVISAIKVAKKEGMEVTLWHYDRDTGTYYSQEV